MAARWTLRTRRPMPRPSAGPAPAAAAAPIRKSALFPWSRTARTCCSAARWRAMERVRSLWPRPCCRVCGRACCAWRTGNFSASGCGAWRARPGPICSGGSRKTRAFLVRGNCRTVLDGSYLSHIYPSDKDRRRKTNGVAVRVIDYCLDGIADAEPIYRLVTTILDHDKAPAAQLAALYHERWEIETALDELKTHLRGARIVLRSKTPDLVRQEFYGLLMAHFAVRGLMHEAALQADEDPDRLSFLHAVRVVRRKLPTFHAIPPSALPGPASGGAGRNTGRKGGLQPRPQCPAGS